jgi:hypothetical protein
MRRRSSRIHGSCESIGGTQGAGFLGVEYDPFVVDNPAQRVANLVSPPGIDLRRRDSRLSLLDRLNREFESDRGDEAAAPHRNMFDRAKRLSRDGIFAEVSGRCQGTSSPAKLRDVQSYEVSSVVWVLDPLPLSPPPGMSERRCGASESPGGGGSTCRPTGAFARGRAGGTSCRAR